MNKENNYEKFLDIVNKLDKESLRNLIYDICRNNFTDEDLEYYVGELNEY